MALSEQQKIDTRRWLGYPLINVGYPDTVYSLAFSHNLFSVSLTAKLAGLSAAEENILITAYLDKLAEYEQAITDAADNLDFKAAGPWTANPAEVQDRRSLFTQQRRALGYFLGFAPGPAVGSGSAFFTRA